MPVGEVTLISVSQSPITSVPTKITPQMGAAASFNSAILSIDINGEIADRQRHLVHKRKLASGLQVVVGSTYTPCNTGRFL
jgi:hypothetical protein